MTYKQRAVALLVIALMAWPALSADTFLADFICGGVSETSERAECVERAAAVIRQETQSTGKEVPWYSALWPLGWWLIYYAVGVLIGRYIYKDAKQRDWVCLGIRPVWWAALAVFDPAFGLLVYWATHYSKFAQSYQEATAKAAPSAADA